MYIPVFDRYKLVIYNTMIKNKIKIQFFQHEINHLSQFSDSIQQIRAKIKQVIPLNDLKKQTSTLKQINKQLCYQINSIKNQIIETTKQSNLAYDENRVQQKIIFNSYENKIDQLNNRLIIAENGVQKAEITKKQFDAEKPQYQMSKVKNLKKQAELIIFQNFLLARHKVIKEFMRSIQLLMKVKHSQKSNKNQATLKLLKLSEAKVPYTMVRKLVYFNENRKSKSEQKYCFEQKNEADIKFYINHKKSKKSKIKQPLSLLFLKSSNIHPIAERQMALKKLISNLKIRNQEQAKINKQLSYSLEEKDKEQVLNYLQTKQQLNQEESIVKLELMSVKLNRSIDERLLSLKYKKPCKQYYQKNDRTQLQNENNNTRLSKSEEKNKFDKTQQMNKIQKHKNNSNFLKFDKIMLKQGTSNPKTNDSLTQAYASHI